MRRTFNCLAGLGLAMTALATGSDAADAPAYMKQGEHFRYESAARLYSAACASCHYSGATRADFRARGPAGDGDPEEMLQSILFGAEAEDDIPGLAMPPFGSGLSDKDIAGLAAYLRATRTTAKPWTTLVERAAALRKSGRVDD